MNKSSLTEFEKQKIESLSIKKIINDFPDLVIKAMESTVSYSAMLSELGVSTTNTSARKSIKKFLECKGLQVPNYRLHQSSLSTAPAKERMTKEDVLTRFIAGDRHIGTQLRKWVIEYNLIPYRCATPICMLADESDIIWNGVTLTLDLDHINGDNTDNRLDNLRWLCPNCHSQTETYKGKNKRFKDKPIFGKDINSRREAYKALPNADDLWNEIKVAGFSSAERKYNVPRHSLKIKLLEYTGADELVEKIKDSVRKTQVNHVGNYLASPTYKATYPPVDEMVARVTSDGYESLARELGVSGNAIRKYLTHRLGYTPKRAGWGEKSKAKDQDKENL